ncbi:MAG TPA: exostosin family protein [Candidatus Paceibacterota bacterium]|nr:exostosin family protein [Candidatus Paceibacterota bacterium]
MSNSAPTKIHVAAKVIGEPVLFLIESWEKDFTQHDSSTIFINALPKDWGYKNFILNSSPEDADYILAPHAVRRMDDKGAQYVDDMRAYAKKYGKELIIFTGGDLQHDVYIDDAIVLKGSQYRPLLRDNEILVPAFVEDLTDTRPVEIRHKSDKPIVAFCGFAGINTRAGWAKFYLRNALIDLKATLTGTPSLRTFKRGIYFRRKAMRALERDPRIETRFIIRNTFSGNAGTISLDPTQARTEYLENMRDCDFMLAPKGDGNFSLRFYEALSMGRIPLFIDTDAVLPLEDVIDYSNFMLRVPYTELARLPDIVAEFYDSLSDEKFVEMQRLARAAFAQYLRYDAFFSYLFGTRLART